MHFKVKSLIDFIPSLNWLSLCFLIAILMLCSGCVSMHIPTGAYTPLHKDAGDFSACHELGYRGFSGYASYSPVKHFGLMLDGNVIISNSNEEEKTPYTFNNSLNTSIGLYSEIKQGLICELFGGVGMSDYRMINSYNPKNGYLTGRIQRMFIQPGIGMRSDFITLSFATRYSLNQYLYSFDESEGNMFSGTMGSIDPVINASLGFEYVKFSVQGGLSIPDRKLPDNFSYVPFIFQLGIQYNFSLLKRIKTAEIK